MANQYEHQRSPRLSSAFSSRSREPVSPRTPFGESPRTFSRRSSSFVRHASVGTQQQQEEAYFADLLSYSLERLGREPELLTAERDQLKRQSQESAIKHYEGFIEVASCLRELKTEVTAVGEHLASLQQDLPALSEACTSFSTQSQELAVKRSQNKQLLKQQAAVSEILEVPTLMETCVRNGSYEDALDLRAFVSKTALLHPTLQVVQELVKQTDAISQDMLAGLIDRLRGNIQLPECLRVVAHLRRLAPFSEARLRGMFLRCREGWLAELVAALDESNAYDYLKRLTDVHRLQLFDVVMQYRAIFADESSSGDDSSSTPGTIVYDWAEHRVVFYLEAVAKQLPRIREGGALASVLEHCMYCGLSLGRVGLDFRGLLPPIFEACVFNLFSASVQAAVETSLLVLDMHKWVALPSLAARRGKSPLQPTGPPLPRPPSGREKEGGPPYALMEHPPLAMLTNGLLSALNELRHCAPLSLAPQLAAVLQDALSAVVKTMAHYRATRALSEEETALLQSACTAMVDTFCPYIATCFSQIFPDVDRGLLELGKVTAALAEQPAAMQPDSPAQHQAKDLPASPQMVPSM